MQIQQSLRVPFAPDQVWRRFHDIEGIVGCLPGAGLTAPPSEGRLLLSMAVKLGPIVANFAGQGQMWLDDTERRGRIVGGGSDRKSGSRIKGEAAFSLHDESTSTAATRIEIRVDYSIAGSLAQFSRDGIVRELAERMTGQFGANLQKKLAAQIPTAPAAPLNLGGMLPAMLIARFKRWFGRFAKSLDHAGPRDD
ncbi:MAG: SRPBCC family protein [Steroidobacteraceae bacterium]